MDLNFITDPEMAPRPREEIEILDLALTPYPDRRRVKVSLQLTPFAPVDRPNLEISAVNAAGSPVGDISVIGAMQTRLHLTMHLREPEIDGEYVFSASLSYDDQPPQHELTTTVDLSPDASASAEQPASVE